MGRMCGDCAKKSGLLLEYRMELSKIGEDGEPYFCSVCLVAKKVPNVRKEKMVYNSIIPKVSLSVKAAKAAKKEVQMPNVEQLQFFDMYDSIEFQNGGIKAIVYK